LNTRKTVFFGGYANSHQFISQHSKDQSVLEVTGKPVQLLIKVSAKLH